VNSSVTASAVDCLERFAFSDLKFVDRCEMASLTYSLLHMSRVVVVVVAVAVAVAVAVS